MTIRSRFSLILITSAVLATCAGCNPSKRANVSERPSIAAAPRNRAEFAAAMHKVREEMCMKEVRRLIGEPEDVLTDSDWAPGIRASGIVAWCYGTEGHNTLATLGSVAFDGTGRVISLTGGHGSNAESSDDNYQNPLNPPDPPEPEVISEHELRSLLTLLDQFVNERDLQCTFDPLIMIRTVNALQPLGKEKAIAAIQEYHRVAPDHPACALSLELLLWTLFDLPKGIELPSGVSIANRFNSQEDSENPILMSEDVPFFIGARGGSTGPTPTAFPIIRIFKEHGTIREKRLLPPNVPVVAVLEAANAIWSEMAEPDEELVDAARRDYLEQLLLLLRTVHPLKLDEFGRPYAWIGGCDRSEIDAVQEKLSKLKVVWDPLQQKYTNHDGTSIPEPVHQKHPRHKWSPKSMSSIQARVTLQRSSPAYVWLLLEWRGATEVPVEQFTIRVSAADKTLLSLHVPEYPLLVSPATQSAESTELSHVVELSDRVRGGSEINGEPDVFVEVTSGDTLMFEVFRGDGAQTESWSIAP